MVMEEARHGLTQSIGRENPALHPSIRHDGALAESIRVNQRFTPKCLSDSKLTKNKSQRKLSDAQK
jgi:hypothetical protein